MPSEEVNKVLRVTRMYQAQIQQCQKMVDGMKQRTAAESDNTGKDITSGQGKAGSEGNSTDLRNRIARQWRCPGFAWKALEAMPVRSLFRATQSSKDVQKPVKETDENSDYIRTGESLLSAVENGGVSEKKLVTIVLAFQRWRHCQLKNIIGQELRKVLEEAREDETVLASLSTELQHRDQQLATARANSLRLHSQLAMLATNVSSNHENHGHSADNSTVSKSDGQMMAVEELKEADHAEIQLRDNQIQRLKERIRSMEDHIERSDGELGRLQNEKSDLQAENSIVLRENKDLLEQLSSREKVMTNQAEEMKRLKSLAARLVEQVQNSKQHKMAAQHFDTSRTALQEHLQQAFGANCSKEVELTTSVERCSHLKHEGGCTQLLLQLQEAEKRADLASTRAEELCAKLQCTSTVDDRVESSTEATVASEMVNHLKKLTQHVRRCATPEFDMSSTSTVHDDAQWITWKWRWAAASARAELLARKLHGIHQKPVQEDSSHLDDDQKVQELIQKLSIGNLVTSMEEELNIKLVPLVLSAWRAFTRTSALERKNISRSALLDKMLEALPWWIRKVRERRQLERSFFQWLVLTLSAHRQPNSQQDHVKTRPRSRVVVEPEPRSLKMVPSSTKLRPSDENVGVVTMQPRGNKRAPAANANPKRYLQENKNHLLHDPQTRVLQTLQTTLQQEVGELKKILCQEMNQPLQRNSQMKGRPVTAPTESSYAKQRRPDGKKVLKSVLGVCNNLALALTNVRGKLDPHMRPVNTTLSTVRSNVSPRILADTVNSCIRSEQTKISKGTGSTAKSVSPRRQFIQSDPKRLSPCRERLVPGIRRVTSAPVMDQLQAAEPCCNKHHKMEMENTTMKGQEIGRYYRYNRGTAPLCRSPRRAAADLVLDDSSLVDKLLGDRARVTSLKEKTLMESALARLVSTKISKLRGGQAV